MTTTSAPTGPWLTATLLDSVEHLPTLLDGAERTALNTGQWRANWPDLSIWIGEPGGARTGQWEANVVFRRGLRESLGVDLRSRTFTGLKRAILKVVATGGAS